MVLNNLEEIILLEHKETKETMYVHASGWKNQPLERVYTRDKHYDWNTLEEWKEEYDVLKKYIRYE